MSFLKYLLWMYRELLIAQKR